MTVIQGRGNVDIFFIFVYVLEFCDKLIVVKKEIILKNMKGIFIAYDQAYNMEIADVLDQLGCRGFTMWQDIAGRGGYTGEPHLGNHAWPTMNNAILTFVPDEKVDAILEQLRAMDEETPDLGIRAFAWNVEKSY